MSTVNETIMDRAELCEAIVTLDGEPARITGYMKEFASVTKKSTGVSATFAWDTVSLVVSRGGKFRL